MNRKIVFSLDAGGTNLVFSAIEDGKERPEIHVLPSDSKSLEDFFNKLVKGFSQLKQQLKANPVAISFCFPGPADYEAGIIGKLENLPFFTEKGTPLAKMLENYFKVPVFINNDGDLFTLGEALGGLLPEINKYSNKKFKNLLGVTLGTGFGGGIIQNFRLLRGDNSASGEINRLSNFLNREQSVEEVLSIRGVKNLYSYYAAINTVDIPEPIEIYKIAKGNAEGNRDAAIKVWKNFGTVLGDALANAVTLTDSCVVVGGGLSGAYDLFFPYALKQMNSMFKRIDGKSMERMEIKAFNWQDINSRDLFLKDEAVKISVPFSNQTIIYRGKKKIAIGLSKLGTSNAVALGAYAYAARRLGFQE